VSSKDGKQTVTPQKTLKDTSKELSVVPEKTVKEASKPPKDTT